MPMTDPYKVLGIPTTATDDEVKQAYRRLAKRYHPDANPGDKAAEQRMKEINAAYDHIINGDTGGAGSAGGYESYGGYGGYGGQADFLRYVRSLPNYETSLNTRGGGVSVSYKKSEK